MSLTVTAPSQRTSTRAAAAAAAAPGEVRPTTGMGSLPDGPWTHAFWVAVPGAVRSKSNHRQDRKSRGKWDANSAYEMDVLAAVKAAKPAGWAPGNPAAGVADRPRVIVVMAARTMLDSGNISKSFLDACQGPLYVSDAQVAAQSEVVTRTGDAPTMLAAFAQLPPGAPAAQCAVALGQLLAQTTDLFYEAAPETEAETVADSAVS